MFFYLDVLSSEPMSSSLLYLPVYDCVLEGLEVFPWSLLSVLLRQGQYAEF